MFNVPIIGYPITKAPVNLTAHWALGDRAWTSNFGQETQYNIFPTGYSPLTYSLAQGMSNPYHISRWNPMLIGMNLGVNEQAVDPALAQYGIDIAKQNGAQMMAQALLQQDCSSLAAFENQIKSILKSDKLDDSQKAQLEAVLEQIKELKEKIKSMNNPSLEEITAVREEISEVLKNASEVANKILEEVKTRTEAEATEEQEGTDETETTDETESSETSEEDSNAKKELDFALTQVCHKIDQAIDGCGTNYDSDENGLLPVMKASVTPDTVLELFDAWDKNYANLSDYAADDDGFIESLMDDCEGGQKEEIALILVDAMETRAFQKGIDVSKEVAAARLAVKSNWIGWRNDDAIQTAVNDLRNKLKSAEADKVKANKEKTKTEETEKEQDKANKAEEAKALFLSDMREIFGNEEAEISDKVEYTENGFKVRIEGRDYYGKDFRTLKEKIEKAGYDAEKYLTKQQYQAAA